MIEYATPVGLFTDFAVAGFIGYLVYVFHKTIEKQLVTYSAKEHYLGLYDLFKLNGELEERKLSFDKLDAFGKRFYPSKKDSKRLADIDEEYEKKKEDKKEVKQ